MNNYIYIHLSMKSTPPFRQTCHCVFLWLFVGVPRIGSAWWPWETTIVQGKYPGSPTRLQESYNIMDRLYREAIILLMSILVETWKKAYEQNQGGEGWLEESFF